MEKIKMELIEHLLNNYLEVDDMLEATGDKDYDVIALKIDSYLGYLGVDTFMLEDRIFHVEMEDGYKFTKDFNIK